MREVIDGLLKFSDAQLDPAMRVKIMAWDAFPTALQVLEVLDHCVHGALASGFVIKVLEIIFSDALKRQGLLREDVVKLAVWRAAR